MGVYVLQIFLINPHSKNIYALLRVSYSSFFYRSLMLYPIYNKSKNYRLLSNFESPTISSNNPIDQLMHINSYI
jgi:hypothetical protein